MQIARSMRRALRLLAVVAGVALIVWLIQQAGAANLWRELQKLGWVFAWIIALAGVGQIARTWAWRITLGADRRKISFSRMLGLRLATEAAGQIGILGHTFGDTVRVAHLSNDIRVANSLASVTLDRGLYVTTAMIAAVSGILAALPLLSSSRLLRLYAAIFALVAVSFLLFVSVAARKRWPLLSGAARLAGRVPSLRNSVADKLHVLEATEDALFDFHHNTPVAFWTSFALNLAAQCLAVLEVALILWLLGAPIGFLGALIVEGLTKVVNLVGDFNPGNVGTYETGNVLIGKIFDLSSIAGLTLALARRLRALVWSAAGCVCLVLLTKSKKLQDFDTIATASAIQSSGSPVSDVAPSQAAANGEDLRLSAPPD